MQYTTQKALGTFAVIALCLTGALPSRAQRTDLGEATVRMIVPAQNQNATETLRLMIYNMRHDETDEQRDKTLSLVKQAIAQGADIRARFIYPDGTEQTVLEYVVAGGMKFNPDNYANLFNLLVANGAHPIKDLRPPYDQWAAQLPLEENTAWQNIPDPQPQPSQNQTTIQIIRTNARVSIHVPEEYNTYSCRKLRKMYEEGTLPPVTVTRDSNAVVTVEEVPVYHVGKKITIQIPEEYSKYSCRKLHKMQENGTLPKPTVIRQDE